MHYIKTPAAHEKLEKAERELRPVIMLAAAGWGKTAAAEHFYRRKPVLYLTGKSGSLDSMPEPDSIRRGVVIVDDISWLTDSRSEEYIIELLERRDRLIVLLGRGGFPSWLSGVAFEMDFVRINERDLMLTEDIIAGLFERAGVPLSEEELKSVTEVTQGYPLAVKLCLDRAEQGQRVDRAMFGEVRIELFHYYQHAFFERWPKPVRELLLSVCRYPSFTTELAGLLSGRRDVTELLEYCRGVGSFLSRSAPGIYTLREELVTFLKWEQELLWPYARIEENYRRAALYYKTRDEISLALKYYELAGAERMIQQTLIEHASLHPGVGQYHELRKYYAALPRELILESPVLMASMSMLCSLTMKPEESEQWYRELASFEKNSRNPSEKRREARARLAYLDIGLPHRAGKGLIGIFKKIFLMHQKEHIDLPEMAVTGNYPSLMNGGLDFCDWAKNGEQVARFMAKPVETLMGSFGKGLVNVALGESGFERGTMSPYEVVTRLNNGYAAADNGGKIEMCFAARGVLIRQHVARGQLPTAKKLLSSFRAKTEAEGASRLIPNIEALEIWLSLYQNDSSDWEGFISKIPDVHTDFYIPRRFRCAVALRCLIAMGRLSEAMDLAGYLTHYYTEYKRTYLRVENELLKAVILYREGEGDWRPVLENALKTAAEYHLTRVVSMEGAAVLPLLTELKSDAIPAGFMRELIRDTREIALFYPDYMRFTPVKRLELTPREQEILGMLLAGETTEEICRRCGISYSGLKKHNRSIYAKLGVSNRAEAERTALRLGLAHRKDVEQ